MNSVGNKIKLILEDKGLTYAETERRAGLKAGTLRNITIGRSKNPKVETLNAICKALGYDLTDFIEDTILIQRNGRSSSSAVQSTNSKEQTITIENHPLFIDCTMLVMKFLKVHEVNVKLNQVFNLIKESYIYALYKNNSKADPTFTEWIIEKLKENN